MYSEYKYFLVIFHQVFVGTRVFTVWSFFSHQIIVSKKQTPKKSSVCCFWKLHPLISNPPKASSARCWWKLGNSVCWGKFLDCWLWKCKHLFAKCAKYKCRNIKCKTWKCANVEICKIQFGGKFVKFLALDWVLGGAVCENVNIHLPTLLHRKWTLDCPRKAPIFDASLNPACENFTQFRANMVFAGFKKTKKSKPKKDKNCQHPSFKMREISRSLEPKLL